MPKWNNESVHRVAEYDQAKAWGNLLGRLRKDISAHEGVCQELSAKWVRMVTRAILTNPSPYSPDKQKVLKTPAGRMNSLQQSSTMKKAIITHERGTTPLGNEGALRHHELLKDMKFGTGKKFSLPQEDVNEAYGVVAKLKNIGGSSIDEVVTAVCSSKTTCFIILLTCDAGRHAVACYTGQSPVQSMRDVFFFDPNYGEYKLTCASFKSWFLGYLGQDLYKKTSTSGSRGLPSLQLYTCGNRIVDKQNRLTQSPNWYARMLLIKELMDD
jgi:hypothetical protein